jgi:hypothetical protein
MIHRLVIDPADRFLRETIELFLWALDSAVHFDVFHVTDRELYRYCLTVMEHNGNRPIVVL